MKIWSELHPVWFSFGASLICLSAAGHHLFASEVVCPIERPQSLLVHRQMPSSVSSTSRAPLTPDVILSQDFPQKTVSSCTDSQMQPSLGLCACGCPHRVVLYGKVFWIMGLGAELLVSQGQGIYYLLVRE